MSTTHYHEGKLKTFAQIVAVALRGDPTLVDDADRLWSTILVNVPALGKRETCPNCEASMQEYIFEFDLMDALLLFSMAREVAHRLEQRSPQGAHYTFTEANQIKTTQLDTTYAARSRTTQCSKLGLVAKYRGENGRQIPGTWVITARGWAALRGEEVPKSVRVWRGKILERPEETITIGEALRSNQAKNDSARARGKEPRNDYGEHFRMYDPQEWVHFAGVHQGELL